MPYKGTIVVTGASGAIGAASARALLAAGWKVLLTDFREEPLRALGRELGGNAWRVANMAKADEAARCFDSVAEDLSGAVLAAGIEGPIGPLESLDDDSFNSVMDANVITVWQGLKNALRILKPKGRGSIVALASISGLGPAAFMSPYAASKHAVLGLVRTAAREAGRLGVRVNAVCPGPVASPMMRRIDAALEASLPGRNNAEGTITHTIPMQRYATPEVIADTVAYLCSDAAQYTTGASIVVDGGITCRS